MVVFEKLSLNAQRMVLYVNNTREFYDIKCKITKVIEEYLKANKFVSVVRLMNDDNLKDLVFKSAKYHFKHDGEMPTQKERKQACAYLACAIINTAKDNLNLN
jgi:hypothetical protein|nr:MAG TPA: hypothetical protein [Caudoviricetes sp.]